MTHPVVSTNRSTIIDVLFIHRRCQFMENGIQLSHAPLTVAEPGSQEPVRVALYIDADNQSSQIAPALMDLLCDGLGARIIRATIAGNSDGKVSVGWSAALREQIPDLPINAIVVPCRKDAADVALILALGADLADHLRLGVRVVLVSRDALLLAAAERVKAFGCRIYAAYADGAIPTARSSGLTTLLLPAIPSAGTQTEVPPLVAITPQAPAPSDSVTTPADVAKVIAQIRALCKQQPGGGYSATDVGQALTTLGYQTPAARKRVIATFPGLREKGAHPHKLLIF